jgi:hypothetical protein
VVRRIVQRGPAKAVHGGAGVRGWAPRGYPSTQPVPETKLHVPVFWFDNRSRKRVPREDSAYSPSRSPLAHPPNLQKFGKSRKRRLRPQEAARNFEIRQYGRGAYGSRNVAS